MECIENVKSGKLAANEANAIAKLAGQISLSMQVEANIRLEQIRGLGETVIGEGTAAPELRDAAPRLRYQTRKA